MTDAPSGDAVPSALGTAIEQTLRAAIHGDDDRMRAAMLVIADESFPAGLGYACYTWARIAAAALLGTAQQLLDYSAQAAAGDGSAGVQFVHGGQVVNAEDVPLSSRFVGRMVACAFNDDDDAAVTIWGALDGGELADCAVAMVRFAASAVTSRVMDDLGGASGAVP